MASLYGVFPNDFVYYTKTHLLRCCHNVRIYIKFTPLLPASSPTTISYELLIYIKAVFPALGQRSVHIRCRNEVDRRNFDSLLDRFGKSSFTYINLISVCKT